MKILFFDLETTGLYFWKNAIHQISGEIVIDGVTKEAFNLHMAPHPKAIVELEALAVAGVTEEQIRAYPPQEEVFKQFIEMLSKYVNRYDKKDKFYKAGYNNASFDNAFLSAWFKQCGDNYFGSWFWPNSLDVMTLATPQLNHKQPNMENFKLMTVARNLGIEVDDSKLHDASYDIFLTKEIYKLVCNQW